MKSGRCPRLHCRRVQGSAVTSNETDPAYSVITSCRHHMPSESAAQLQNLAELHRRGLQAPRRQLLLAGSVVSHVQINLMEVYCRCSELPPGTYG